MNHQRSKKAAAAVVVGVLLLLCCCPEPTAAILVLGSRRTSPNAAVVAGAVLVVGPATTTGDDDRGTAGRSPAPLLLASTTRRRYRQQLHELRSSKKDSSVDGATTGVAVNPQVQQVPVPISKEGSCDDRCELFYRSLQSFESKEAKELLDQLQTARRTNGESSADAFLQQLSSCLPASTTPWWAKQRYRFLFWTRTGRRRARWASCRQALDYLTPPATNDDEEDGNGENLARRQRRAILSLLRTLSQPAASNGFDDATTSNVPAIRQIERRAARESRQTLRRMRRAAPRRNLVEERRPKDLETPTYKILYQSPAGLEIRQYDPYRVCTYDMSSSAAAGRASSYNPATDAATMEPAKGNVRAFGALAGYLFGKNQEQVAMKMTAPVFMNTDDQRQTKSMSFVLPSNYWGNDDDAAAVVTATRTATGGAQKPPQPLPESGVRIETVATTETTRAVWPFGGYARNVAAQSDELLRQLRRSSRDHDWVVAPGATVQLAQYNDPFTPPWKRLNEVSIAVIRKGDNSGSM